MKNKLIFLMAISLILISSNILYGNIIKIHSHLKQTQVAKDLYKEIIADTVDGSGDLEIDFKALQLINPDIIAWINIPGTKINYPVMKAKDYSYYLNHLPNGVENKNGSIFLDYNGNQDFKGNLEILYGHHMASGEMFASIVEYEDEYFLNEHRYIYIYTEDQNYVFEILYGKEFNDNIWRDRGFMYPNNIDNLLGFMSDNTYENLPNNSYIVLSTCSFDYDADRFAVIGRLIDK